MSEKFGIAEAKKDMAKRDRLQDFKNSAGYKEFIEEGFCRDEVVRISEAITQNAMQDDIEQRLLGEMFRAPGHLKNYEITIIQIGNTAQGQLQAEREAEAEALRERDVIHDVEPISGDTFLVEEK